MRAWFREVFGFGKKEYETILELQAKIKHELDHVAQMKAEMLRTRQEVLPETLAKLRENMANMTQEAGVLQERLNKMRAEMDSVEGQVLDGEAAKLAERFAQEKAPSKKS